MLEKDIEKKVRIAIELMGGRLEKWVCPGETGVTDRICILPGGRVAFIEFKKPDGKLSERQKLWIQRLKELGQDVRVIWSTPQAEEFIQEMRKWSLSHIPIKGE